MRSINQLHFIDLKFQETDKVVDVLIEFPLSASSLSHQKRKVSFNIFQARNDFDYFVKIIHRNSSLFVYQLGRRQSGHENLN